MKIVINRSDAIGDTLLTLPLAQALKEQYPKAEIYFLISPRTKDLFLNHPYINDVILLPATKTFFGQFFYLFHLFRKLKIDHYLYAGGSHVPSWVAWLLGIPYRGGNANKLSGLLLLGHGQRQRRSQVEMHEAEYNLNLLRNLGINYESRSRGKYMPKVYLQEEEKLQALHDLKQAYDVEKLVWRDEYILVHPGMSGHTLNWSSRNYARFILQMEARFPKRFNYLVSYTPTDGPYLIGLKDELSQKEYAALRERVYYLDGSKKGLRNYMAILSGAQLFLGPSTGTTHLANALNVPLIAIYSPIKVQSGMRWGPFPPHKFAQVVVPDVICGESFQCAGKSCPYFECMSKVEVPKIVNLAFEIINNKQEKKV